MTHPLLPLVRIFDFDGRSRRRELWSLLWIVAAGLSAAMAWDAYIGRERAVGGIAGPVTVIMVLSFTLPVTAAVIRRLHDVGRPAATLAMLLVPVIGWIVLIGWLATPGGRGANRFGPDPKGPQRRAALLAGH